MLVAADGAFQRRAVLRTPASNHYLKETTDDAEGEQPPALQG
jgi:hypothetical protein